MPEHQEEIAVIDDETWRALERGGRTERGANRRRRAADLLLQPLLAASRRLSDPARGAEREA
jgi:hypothetical protein